MRTIAFIEDEEVIEKILKRLGLLEVRTGPPPKVKVPSVTIPIDYSDPQVPFLSHPSIRNRATRCIPAMTGTFF
jgi:hypothetical protein